MLAVFRCRHSKWDSRFNFSWATRSAFSSFAHQGHDDCSFGELFGGVEPGKPATNTANLAALQSNPGEVSAGRGPSIRCPMSMKSAKCLRIAKSLPGCSLLAGKPCTPSEATWSPMSSEPRPGPLQAAFPAGNRHSGAFPRAFTACRHRYRP